MENETLNLLHTPPQEQLNAWLSEIYGKPVEIEKRQVLRHRDLSFVERLWLKDALPRTLIYKVVLPPWDIEQDLHEHILIPSVSNSARLYLSGTFQSSTALFMEDLGEKALLDSLDSVSELPAKVGTELAKLHRAYTYRIAEISETRVLRTLAPADFVGLARAQCQELKAWEILSTEAEKTLLDAGEQLSEVLKDEPLSLVHGDLYAENLLFDGEHLYIIDWSWFTKISAPILDLATLSMEHFKNGALADSARELIEAYCLEYSRNLDDVLVKLPLAELASRLLFLEWLIERRRRGILGTTVGPVEILIQSVIKEISMRLENCRKQS